MLADYSKSAYEPILLIKKQIEKMENEFNVEIKNSHGRNYIVYSKIDVGQDSVRIENDIHNNFYGTKRDTVMTFVKNDFIKLLDTELSQADSQIRIAGNYQDIKIIIADSTELFYTRQGLGIMTIMEKGKSNMTKSKNN
ncbi:hypothetical protein AAT17_04490 [Nonlabens sp. MIC269]|nr:hypothetical protein AAT17_04490 [Nonlabens sp. MIC269]